MGGKLPVFISGMTLILTRRRWQMLGLIYRLMNRRFLPDVITVCCKMPAIIWHGKKIFQARLMNQSTIYGVRNWQHRQNWTSKLD